MPKAGRPALIFFVLLDIAKKLGNLGATMSARYEAQQPIENGAWLIWDHVLPRYLPDMYETKQEAEDAIAELERADQSAPFSAGPTKPGGGPNPRSPRLDDKRRRNLK